jgi:hypothetical protein
MNEREIFIAARHIASDELRCQFFEQACGGDAELRRRVVGLLQAQSDAGSFLQVPFVAVYASATRVQPILEEPGTQIGPY